MDQGNKREFPHVAIVGSGISGILMGIKLIEKGIGFTIYEKSDDVGGTWRDNSYPGLYCDVPAHTYVYSFAPEPNWKTYFAAGPDILTYYRRMAKRYGVMPHIRFNSEVTAAEWRNDRWHLTTGNGETAQADIVITATGRLHHPSMPDIKGLEDFAGPVFHSARWRHDVAFEGKRVGVVGTGSSSAQITVALAPQVDRLSLFQRTPHWVINLPNTRYPWWQRSLFKLFPGRLTRHINDLVERTTAGFGKVIGSKEDRADFDRLAYESLATVRDPVLREKLTPHYEPGCKRLIVSTAFYDTVQKPNVDVVANAIDHVAPDGIVTEDGKLHRLDALVLATGFHATAFMRPMKVTGLDGMSIDEVFDEHFLNYRSVAVPHMPNFFMLNGPYAATSMSIVSLIELQVDLVLEYIARVIERRVSLTPRVDRCREMLTAIRERAKLTVWGTGGCKSWYLDKDGVPIYNPLSFDEQIAFFTMVDFDDFEERPLKQNSLASA